MKISSKILSAGLSAVMLLTAVPLTAGAVSAADCKNILITSTVNCDSEDCKSIQKLVSDICKNGNCSRSAVISFLPDIKKCIGEGCNTSQPQKTTEITANNLTKQDQTKPAQDNITRYIPASAPETKIDKTQSESGFNTAFEDEVIRLVNAERAKNGLSALQKDEGATAAAHIRAKEIVQSFSHTRPDGSSCFTAAKQLGLSYNTAGENIASGYADPQQVVNGWMNSEGHRRNILSSSFTKLGTGCFSSGGVLYWTQFFIG